MKSKINTIIKSSIIIISGLILVVLTSLGSIIELFPHINMAQEISIVIVGILLIVIGISNIK